MKYYITILLTILSFLQMPSLYYFFGNPMVGEGLNYDEVTFYFDDPTTAPLPDGTPTAAPIALDEVNGGNPHLVCKHGQVTNGPSVSWWVLFLGVRQVITLGFARAAQFLIMNYVLKINFSGMMGPSVRLLFLQARGWPFIMVSPHRYEALDDVVVSQVPVLTFALFHPFEDALGSLQFYHVVWTETLCSTLDLLPGLDRIV